MWILIVCLAAPLAAAPLLVFATRHLFAIFVREGASLFVGLDMHRDWAITLGTDMAVVNVAVFALAWWATVGLGLLHLSTFIVAAPFILAMALDLWFTSMLVRSRLHLANGSAWMVGLLTFAGGNLPLLLLLPLLLAIALAA